MKRQQPDTCIDVKSPLESGPESSSNDKRARVYSDSNVPAPPPPSSLLPSSFVCAPPAPVGSMEYMLRVIKACRINAKAYNARYLLMAGLAVGLREPHTQHQLDGLHTDLTQLTSILRRDVEARPVKFQTLQAADRIFPPGFVDEVVLSNITDCNALSNPAVRSACASMAQARLKYGLPCITHHSTVCLYEGCGYKATDVESVTAAIAALAQLVIYRHDVAELLVASPTFVGGIIEKLVCLDPLLGSTALWLVHTLSRSGSESVQEALVKAHVFPHLASLLGGRHGRVAPEAQALAACTLKTLAWHGGAATVAARINAFSRRIDIVNTKHLLPRLASMLDPAALSIVRLAAVSALYVIIGSDAEVSYVQNKVGEGCFESLLETVEDEHVGSSIAMSAADVLSAISFRNVGMKKMVCESVVPLLIKRLTASLDRGDARHTPTSASASATYAWTAAFADLWSRLGDQSDAAIKASITPAALRTASMLMCLPCPNVQVAAARLIRCVFSTSAYTRSVMVLHGTLGQCLHLLQTTTNMDVQRQVCATLAHALRHIEDESFPALVSSFVHAGAIEILCAIVCSKRPHDGGSTDFCRSDAVVMLRDMSETNGQVVEKCSVAGILPFLALMAHQIFGGLTLKSAATGLLNAIFRHNSTLQELANSVYVLPSQTLFQCDTDKCSICHDGNNAKNVEVEAQVVPSAEVVPSVVPVAAIIRTPCCQQQFHITCLTEWFRRSDTCPLCRDHFVQSIMSYWRGAPIYE